MPKDNKQRKAEVERQQATSLSAINKLIGSIKRSATKLNESIHKAACMAMQHAKDYGDTTPCARLVDAMPKSYRRSLVINWFAANSPVTIGKAPKSDLMKAHLKGTEAERVWNIEAAKATPFYAMPEAETEPEVPTYDGIMDNVVSYIDRASTRAAKIEDADERRRTEARLAALKQDAVAAAA